MGRRSFVRATRRSLSGALSHRAAPNRDAKPVTLPPAARESIARRVMAFLGGLASPPSPTTVAVHVNLGRRRCRPRYKVTRRAARSPLGTPSSVPRCRARTSADRTVLRRCAEGHFALPERVFTHNATTDFPGWGARTRHSRYTVDSRGPHHEFWPLPSWASDRRPRDSILRSQASRRQRSRSCRVYEGKPLLRDQQTRELHL